MSQTRSQNPDPELSDGVLRLRPWALGDAPYLAAAWADPAIQSHCEVPPNRSPGHAAKWIQGQVEREISGVAIDLVMAEVDSPTVVVGEIGLGPFDWARGAALVGFWVAGEHRGKGYAKRALELVSRWSRTTLRLETLMATTSVANLASGSILESAGFEIIDIGRTDDNQIWAASIVELPNEVV
ncbi:MAG: GNAT family N-acetyltransferase [Acidimicrobiales bacterium]